MSFVDELNDSYFTDVVSKNKHYQSYVKARTGKKYSGVVFKPVNIIEQVAPFVEYVEAETKQAYDENVAPNKVKKAQFKLHKEKKERKSYEKDLPKEYKNYLIRCDKKGWVLDFTIEEFYKVISQNCTYCNKPNAGGIDRKDSKIGYIKENCVPCCTQCNHMKFVYSEDSFLKKVKEIYEYYNLSA